MLQAVLSSGSVISMIGEKGLPRMQKMWLEVQVVFSYELEFIVAMADGQSTLLTQEKCLLTASVLTPWAPVDMKLAVVVLPGGNGEIILGSRALLMQLGIDVMERLNIKA